MIVEEKMMCDCCKMNNFHEIIILRKKKFTLKGKKNHVSKFSRVCFECAKKLSQREYYNFGDYWKGILLNYDYILRRGYGK